ncbi:hypothetical protein HK100_010078, partial [Physocladia obscura]
MQIRFFDKVQVYVRRGPNDGEDVRRFVLLDDAGAPVLTAPASISAAATDPSEFPYRLIAPFPTAYPLTIDVYAGGILRIYGLLRFRIPLLAFVPEKMSITVSVVGHVKIEWNETPFVKLTQRETFLRTKNVILEETDPMPTPDVHSTITLPFAIQRTPTTLPISFESESGKIAYYLLIKFKTCHYKFGNETFEHFVPITVIPPWSGAPPPALPSLAPGDNGVRVVLDVEGTVQGSVKMFGGGGTSSHNAETSSIRTGTNVSEHDGGVGGDSDSLWLRPRVLHDVEGLRPRPSGLSIGGSHVLRQTPSILSENENYNNSYLRPDSQTAMEPPPLEPPSLSRRAVSFSSAFDGLKQGSARPTRAEISSRYLRRAVRSTEAMVVPIVVEETDPNLPLPYTEEDPLAGQPRGSPLPMPIRPFRTRPFLPSSPAYTPLSVHFDGPDEIGILNHLDNEQSDEDHESSQQFTIGEAAIAAENNENVYIPQPDSSAIPKSDGIKTFFKKMLTNAKSRNFSGSSNFHIPRVSSPTDQISDQIPENNNSTPPQKLSHQNSFFSFISTFASQQPQSQLLQQQDSGNDNQYSFNFLLASTMIGPNSQIPITITFSDNEYDAMITSYIEISLIADIECTAMGKTKHDIVILMNVKVDVDAQDFEKRVWFVVPSAKELGYFAVGLTAPLIELTHKVVFQLHTQKRRPFGMGWKDITLELGSVAITMLR